MKKARGFAKKMDGLVIEAAQTGDMSAFEQIYRTYQPAVYTLAMRFCNDRDPAQHLMQHAPSHALTKIGQYRGAAPFGAWLRRIVVTTALQSLRRRKRRDTVTPLRPLPDVDHTHLRDCELDLEQAFARLSQEKRMALWLYAVEGYRHAEIAKMMKKSTSYSKTLVSRARAQLRQWTDTENGSHEKGPSPGNSLNNVRQI